jgi:hypothetical protein
VPHNWEVVRASLEDKGLVDDIGLRDSAIVPFWKDKDLRRLRGLEPWPDRKAFCLPEKELPVSPLKEAPLKEVCFVDSIESDLVEEERKGAPLK